MEVELLIHGGSFEAFLHRPSLITTALSVGCCEFLSFFLFAFAKQVFVWKIYQF